MNVGRNLGYAVATVGLLFSIYIVLWCTVVGVHLREDVMFSLFPSAGRAYEYGERNFNAREEGLYDVDRAEYFFRQAEALDSALPYIHHELARIAFLRGMFDVAMAQINIQIEQQGDATPNSYYIRGLIEGYRGNYASSTKDYERYLKFDPRNWAALNDQAWVLLKAERYAEATSVTQRGLSDFPENPWLLNSSATALYHLGEYDNALAQVTKARVAVSELSEGEWLTAYPGNDPKIAARGVDAFKKAVDDNMHTIMLKVSSSTVQ